MEKTKRYLIFILGLFVNSLGVSLITKANLGTSPISSIPYVLSLNFPLSLGNFTVIFSLLLIFLQLLILGKNFKIEHVLQIPVSFAFGWFIDICMSLLWFLNPQQYLLQIFDLLMGCFILGIGVYMEMLADVVMLPGESFVRAIVFRWKTEFGLTKVCFDVSMTVFAVLLSIIFSGGLLGVREGTIIAAILVGFIARLIGRKLSFLPQMLFGTQAELKTPSSPHSESTPVCIVVDRQYGSGGHDFAKYLAQKLSFAFYDEEIIQMAAGSSKYSEEYISLREEKMKNGVFYDFVAQMYTNPSQTPAPEDSIFQTESKIIREAASKENCVIVGRCADVILKDHPKCLKMFLCAPIESRIKRVMKYEQVDEKTARHSILMTDRSRARYYHYYANRVWGLAPNYHLCIDTSTGAPHAEQMVLDMLEHITGYHPSPKEISIP